VRFLDTIQAKFANQLKKGTEAEYILKNDHLAMENTLKHEETTLLIIF
jgi:hypothetical protein